MRALSQLNVPKNTASEYPFHTLQNETNTQDGTPVIEEIYGDALQNMYKLVQRAGLTFTGTPDNDNTQYQIIRALELFANDLNDKEQTLTLTNTIWSVGFDIDILPDRYVFIARAANAYVSGVNYTFAGTGNNTYSFTSPTGFNASDEILVIIDFSGVRAFTLMVNEDPAEIFPVLSQPLKYNNTIDIYYNQNGSLLKDDFTIYGLINTIRTAESNNNLQMIDMFIAQQHVLCVTYDNVSPEYVFYQFPLSNLSSGTLVTVSGFTMPTGASILSNPVFYFDGNTLLMSNESGASATDELFNRFTYNTATNSLTFVSNITLSDYVKTANGAIPEDDLITFTNGQLNTYSLTTGNRTQNRLFNSFLGQLLIYNGSLYININGIAKRIPTA